jgi:hypothetical protein|tara:strand:+ start:1432 stop:1659 length:228 start_codon:yes stop_codon:yes gene_type:complete
MFKSIDYGYSDESHESHESEPKYHKIIIGRSMLNTKHQFKQNEDKPILEFIKTFRDKEKNLIDDIYKSNKSNNYE